MSKLDKKKYIFFINTIAKIYKKFISLIMLNTKENTQMKTIANKVVKVLKEMDKSSFYKITNQKDYEGNAKFMIQRSKEIYYQFNPMEKDVNFDFENDYDALLTWKKTGERLSKEEYKTYRQALRDLPASASPKLDSNGNLDLTSVTFPTEPT
jgi:uncharacterized membrane protein